jgi:glyoxylase-like metal-dependent hydrolase (beta-lactamase superfamily II)
MKTPVGLAKADAMAGSATSLGDVRITSIIESAMPVLSPWEIFPDCDAGVISQGRAAYGAAHFGAAVADTKDERLVITIQGFVIESGGLRILIDTCVGDCKPRKRAEFNQQAHGWVNALRAAGFAPESIDMVVCTHLHVDHVGCNTHWNGERWIPTFPKARYLITRPDWEHWTSQAAAFALERTGDYIADSVLPVLEAGQLDLVEPDHRIDPHVCLVPAPGHSPGMVMVRIESGTHCLTLAGDLLHSPLQCLQPDWSTRFCSHPDASRATRHQWLKYFARTGESVWPAHFAGSGQGKVRAVGAAYFFEFSA